MSNSSRYLFLRDLSGRFYFIGAYKSAKAAKRRARLTALLLCSLGFSPVFEFVLAYDFQVCFANSDYNRLNQYGLDLYNDHYYYISSNYHRKNSIHVVKELAF